MQSINLLRQLIQPGQPKGDNECAFADDAATEECPSLLQPITVHIFPRRSDQQECIRREQNDEDSEQFAENTMEEAGNEEEEEETETEPSAADLARWHRRRMFPNEVVGDICDFLAFCDCSRLYTLNSLFHALLEPKRKICLELFIKRVEATRQKLDKTIEVTLKEVNERRQHVLQLTGHIDAINIRLADMGNHLAELDSQISFNHAKLEELQERIAKMRAPMSSLENKGK